MQVWDGLENVPTDWPSSVVTIGVFDGVHVGHRALIRKAVEQSALGGMPCVVLTFSPNPVEVVGYGDPPRRLATLDQRLALLASLGVDATGVLHFDESVAKLTPGQFAGSVLSDRLHAGLVVVGTNFHFGHRARGDVDTLEQLGESLGFGVEPVYLLPVEFNGTPVSSSLIRELVAKGDVAASSRLLARPHRVEGLVAAGDARGRELGFPTANVDPTEFAAIPSDGVYAGRLVVDPYGEHHIFDAAVSVGTNPTFEGDSGRRIEAWAYDAGDIDIYDQHVAVDFVDRIRDQETFSGTDQLVTAVKKDEAAIRRIFGG